MFLVLVRILFQELSSKHGFKMVFEFDKFILSKDDMFVCKGNSVSGTSMFNVKNEIISANIVECFDLWHQSYGM